MAALPATQHAAVIEAYGSTDVLKYRTDYPTPTLTADDDSVIVKVSAAGVNPVDYKIRKGYVKLLFGVTFPAVLGIDYAGTIAAVGPKAVGDYKVGDEVYGKFNKPPSQGAYQQYIKLSTTSDVIFKRPASLPAPEAAAVGVGALTALVGLTNHLGFPVTPNPDGPKDKVLIIGASGGVGIFAVQIAKLMGLHVTAVASGANEEFVKSLGADRFVDYKKAPLVEQLSKDEFDGVLDLVGGAEYWQLAQTVLKPKKVFVTASGDISGEATLYAVGKTAFTLASRNIFGGRKYQFIASLPTKDFGVIHSWLADGSLKSIVKHTFPLSEVAKAHQQSESGRTVGKIVLIVP
ncbi:hypothetical protein HDV05_005647 [Chytridiales sp. JEL 0842]|nr:hypothetical protein HDV05_005647 [Chytridiales sp. JEL 0842]